MTHRKLALTGISIAALLAAASSFAQTSTTAQQSTKAMGGDAKRVRITYENLTTGQTLSPSVFFTHNDTAPPFFKEGEPAIFGLMRIAEEGNAGPLLSAEIVKKMGGPYGTAVQGISTPAGMTRSVDIEVTKEHPMISGAFMLVMTNDGFSGINGVNAYKLTEPETMELMAYDAGTENNNEKKNALIALMGTDRDPENGVIKHHEGIRGDADAPAEWKFDPSKPVAKLTITPISTEDVTGSTNK